MSKVTIFSAPKPFSDPHINTIQRNAIRSWKELGSQVKVLLIGDEPGLKEAASDIEVHQIPEVERNVQGTPLVNSIFEQARINSSSEIMIYLNADIILLPEVLEAIDAVQAHLRDFLLVGRRWDLNITQELDFNDCWDDWLKSQLRQNGKLRVHTAMDYFIYPTQLLPEIPTFAVGRAGWDNWMIYHALHQPWPIIDITSCNRVIHQNHDYHHLPDGEIHYKQQESLQNVALAGWQRTTYDLLDVPFVLDNGMIRKKNVSVRRILRKLERWIMPVEQQGWQWQLTRMLRKLGRKLDTGR